VVHAGILGVPVFAAEGTFGSRLLGHFVLKWGESLAEIFVARIVHAFTIPVPRVVDDAPRGHRFRWHTADSRRRSEPTGEERREEVT
jgi:hypothetical protein